MKKPPAPTGAAARAQPSGRAASSAMHRRVWRISDRAPLGEWVDPDIAAGPARLDAAPPAESHGGWLESSMDLLQGTEIRQSDDTLPGELFDAFAPPAPKDPPQRS
jgi:hypothetical protein